MAASVLLCCLTILVLRIRYLRRHRRLLLRIPEWRHVLAAGSTGEIPTLSVAERDRWQFLKMWCQTHDLVRGDAREMLKAMAHFLGMPKWALDLAAKRRLRDRLLGISALGRMGEFANIDQLETLVNHPDPILSLTAAEACARIVPSETLPLILQTAASRGDWPTARLMDIVREAGTEIAKGPLLAAVEDVQGDQRKRLVPLLGCLESRDTVHTVRRMLMDDADPEIQAAALPLTRPDDIPFIRKAAESPAWFVRAKACQMLGEYGVKEDVAILERRLGDPQWWVRYRAAESLLRLPGVSRDELSDLAATHPDRYGREMLRMWLDNQGETS